MKNAITKLTTTGQMGDKAHLKFWCKNFRWQLFAACFSHESRRPTSSKSQRIISSFNVSHFTTTSLACRRRSPFVLFMQIWLHHHHPNILSVLIVFGRIKEVARRERKLQIVELLFHVVCWCWPEANHVNETLQHQENASHHHECQSPFDTRRLLSSQVYIAYLQLIVCLLQASTSIFYVYDSELRMCLQGMRIRNGKSGSCRRSKIVWKWGKKNLLQAEKKQCRCLRVGKLLLFCCWAQLFFQVRIN